MAICGERAVLLALYVCCFVFEQRHEQRLFMPYANNKGADQAAHPCSLISTIVVRCLDSIISLLAIDENLRP